MGVVQSMSNVADTLCLEQQVLWKKLVTSDAMFRSADIPKAFYSFHTNFMIWSQENEVKPLDS